MNLRQFIECGHRHDPLMVRVRGGIGCYLSSVGRGLISV
ncbi:hypothetical protein AXX16_1886 [Serratia rubidaea]|nr:hypothetical protein AXX16_1886 [Serratia rubidaea]